ncbi:hypothetical protein F4820DRAFT_382018 [Hypoxylon rubiginosum]|uniref:Uncharacterized protein n=1 Tax=Hypoxylon rubiginosum TaxID=110542 RepID=A0ACB9ZEA6_9PEZI|nr:hypothetical protein F4820DRAFT_382018 [Hypoxylon rubiginosum]
MVLPVALLALVAEHRVSFFLKSTCPGRRTTNASSTQTPVMSMSITSPKIKSRFHSPFLTTRVRARTSLWVCFLH